MQIPLLKELPRGQEPHVSRYVRFLESRPQREFQLKQGLARHHAFPKGLGGPDDIENIIVLTFREHYLAHLMLWKAYGGKMGRAFWLMSNLMGRTSSKIYEDLKKDLQMSETTRRKMSESKKGIAPHIPLEILREAGRANWLKYLKPIIESGGGMKGKSQSLSARKKISDSLKGRVKTEDHRRHLSESQKGKTLSEEQKEKLLKTHLGIPLEEDHKNKISEALTGCKRSEETKQKMRAAAKLRENKKRLEKEGNK